MRRIFKINSKNFNTIFQYNVRFQAFKDNEVVPDVIGTIPGAVLEVKYTRTGKAVNLGNELAPKDVKDIPEVEYDAESDSFYTLILTDPDAPNRKNPTRREWNHWLVSG